MKEKLFFLLAAIVFFNCTAAGAFIDSAQNKTASWSTSSRFNVISVSDDIDLILIEDGSKIVKVLGPSDMVDAVNLEVQKGELHISSNLKSVNNRVVVFIPVSKLKCLQVNGGSEVYSFGILNSSRLVVRISGNGKMSLRARGNIVIDKKDFQRFAFSK